MLNNTKIKIICNNQLVNTYSDLGYGIWKNPFEFVPCVGDILELSRKSSDTAERFKVIKREIKSVIGYPPRNIEQEVYLYVEDIEIVMY